MHVEIWDEKDDFLFHPFFQSSAACLKDELTRIRCIPAPFQHPEGW